jgi:Protein of unknown function (DUF1822)
MTNLIFIDTPIDEIKIQLTDKIKAEILQETNQLSNKVASFRGYLNLLVRKTFISWLNLMLKTNFSDTVNLEDNLSIWEFVNGNAIDINGSRLILIPIETQDKTEFSIPEEWLKIPDWIGNYYLAVEVNLAENYLNFAGYTSYEDVKTYGKLDSFNHCVDFPYECLENDVSLITLEYQYGWDTIPKILPLPILSSKIKEKLCQEIQDNLSPRLLVNFPQWLSLISDSKIRYQLFSNRQSINLSQWFKGEMQSTLTKGWQTLTELMTEYFIPDFSLTPAFSSRSFSLNNFLQILQQNIDNVEVNNILRNVSNLEINSQFKPEIINILANLVNNSEEEETRWNACLALQSIDSRHESSGIWQGKIITFTTENNNYNFGLLMGILPKNNDTLDIFIRVYSLNQNIHLPNDLQLQIIDQNNNIFASIITNNDSIIQYKFWGNKEEKFKIKLFLNNNYVEEYFSI